MKSKPNTRRGDNSKSKKAGAVILVRNTSSPVLHFYRVSSKFSEAYLCYRVDTKSISNTRRRDNSKSKKAKVVILV